VLGPRRAIASHAPLGAAPDFETGSHRRATGRSGQPDAERLYLRQIARSTLLTREGEVELATRIEEGEREIAAHALGSALAGRHGLELHDRLQAGALRARALVRWGADERDEEDMARQRLLAGLARVRALASGAGAPRRGRSPAAARVHPALVSLGLGARTIDDIVCQLAQCVERQQRLKARLAALRRASDP